MQNLSYWPQAAGGLRIGAWQNLTWGDVYSVCQVGSEYKVGLQKDGKVVCAAMRIYKGTPDQYIALISIEAWEKLQEYKKLWIRIMKRNPLESDPLILERFSKPKAITVTAVKRRIEKILIKSGVRLPLVEGNRRHKVPATHGFRRYWDKVMMNTQQKRGTLSALVIKERLMGHEGLVKTDKNYFWTEISELVPEYLEAMSELMINDESRLKKKLEDEKTKSESMQNVIREKDDALEKLKELED